MATFLEIKDLLKNILCIDTEMDEQCDIIIPNEIEGNESFVIKNDELLTAFINLQTYTKNKLEIYTSTYKLASILYDKSSVESIVIIDKAIVILASRNLIRFDAKKEGRRKLLITELGELAYHQYKEEVKK